MDLRTATTVLLALLAPPGAAAVGPARTRPASTRPAANPLFALCFDTHDSRKRTLGQQAKLLKDLGYDGAGHLWLGKLDERLKTLDERGMRLFQVYLRVNLAAKARPYDARLKRLLPLLKGRGTMLALLVGGGRPSDANRDADAVRIVREIADLSRPFGVRVALYPHANDWLEKVDDAIRLAAKVDRPNVGVMFNLCHWLKTGREKDPAAVLARAGRRLLAVTLHGADTAAAIRAGKGRWIQPLGSGTFDVLALLRTLKRLGYTGPVGLQCYGLPGDARAHLSRSMAAWRRLRKRLAGE